MSTALATLTTNMAKERIEAMSEKIPFGGCWIWTASLNLKGYGQLTFKGKHKEAHKFSFTSFVRDLRKGEWVLHKCDNRSCVNPNHLYAGSPSDNRKDTLERSNWKHPYSLRTHCSKNHEYKVTGFRIDKDNSRVCLACDRERQKLKRSKLKEVSSV